MRPAVGTGKDLRCIHLVIELLRRQHLREAADDQPTTSRSLAPVNKQTRRPGLCQVSENGQRGIMHLLCFIRITCVLLSGDVDLSLKGR